MIEISEVQKRVRQAIGRARQTVTARAARESTPRAATTSGSCSRSRPPLCRMLATVLKAEGYPFQVHTPAGALRLASEKSGDDFIELLLDTMDEPAVVVGRVSRGWGRKVMTHERPIREGARIEHLTEEDVLGFLLSEIEPFVRR